MSALSLDILPALKVEGVAAHLGWLLPNIRGPEIQVRRLYTNVISLMTL